MSKDRYCTEPAPGITRVVEVTIKAPKRDVCQIDGCDATQLGQDGGGWSPWCAAHTYKPPAVKREPRTIDRWEMRLRSRLILHAIRCGFKVQGDGSPAGLEVDSDAAMDWLDDFGPLGGGAQIDGGASFRAYMDRVSTGFARGAGIPAYLLLGAAPGGMSTGPSLSNSEIVTDETRVDVEVDSREEGGQ